MKVRLKPDPTTVGHCDCRSVRLQADGTQGMTKKNLAERRPRSRPPKENTHGQPEASRPFMEGYGIPAHRKGMLEWPDAVKQLAQSRNYR